ncbi:hypothetical protein [Acetobacter conturbans]|uniref:Uncharacterized protein n=1 Tax=Acetobacter conturbans TaxID=1737472 RepID=A0ABX0K5X9_9PROT|nr:hypothetical protein [Acetobacter conturbans]NHN88824.1 hypothetical protein [Acetobacter conturbans]
MPGWDVLAITPVEILYGNPDFSMRQMCKTQRVPSGVRDGGRRYPVKGCACTDLRP